MEAATTMKDEIKFKHYMATLGELHDKTVSPLLMELYWKVLEPFPDEECEATFKQLIYSDRFFPKPADFIEILKGKDSDQATQAWIKTINTVRRIGPYQSVCFDDSTIHSVIEFMGGWPATGDWQEDELKWKQREFERLYGIMQQRGSLVKYLPGVVEMHNSKNGYEGHSEIVQIGDHTTPLKMISGGRV